MDFLLALHPCSCAHLLQECHIQGDPLHPPVNSLRLLDFPQEYHFLRLASLLSCHLHLASLVLLEARLHPSDLLSLLWAVYHHQVHPDRLPLLPMDRQDQDRSCMVIARGDWKKPTEGCPLF